jgi:acetylornithine deacetylase/succinyl-diaminopimelate desuccinylase-like protein
MKTIRITFLVCGVALSTSAAFAEAPKVDWDKQRAEILRLHRELIQIDSTSPPGSETKVADYLKTILEGAGIPVQIFALDPRRANLVARLKGNGKKRPLLLLAHSDTVGVQKDKWPVDPFGAQLKDGYIWGRGSRDDKDKLAANLMAMLLAKRMNVALDRDIIFLSESGEEADPAGVGMNYMVREHFDAIDAEFAITEGGRTTIENGKVSRVDIQTMEKVPRRFRLVATGTSGHGSVPRLDNPLTHLSAAVAKIGTFVMPMRLNATTRTYFEKLAAISPPEAAGRYRALLGSNPPEAVQAYLANKEPEHYSTLRTSIVPTILKAGVGPNVIPSEAEATFDVRALPDEDIPKLFSDLAKLVNDPAVKVDPITANLRPVAPASKLDSDMYRALEKVSAEMYPSATVIPMMSTVATDMAQLRAKGVQAYGIDSASTQDDLINYGFHSDVERLPEASLYSFTEYTWRVTLEVAGAK